MKRQDVIEDKRHEASDMVPKFHGMTYEEGVEAALSWVLDDGDDPLAD